MMEKDIVSPFVPSQLTTRRNYNLESFPINYIKLNSLDQSGKVEKQNLIQNQNNLHNNHYLPLFLSIQINTQIQV